MLRYFIIGEQRSGTNLLRSMLDQSGILACPHPPHVLQHFVPLTHCYGDLAENDAFAQLIDDICTLVEANPVPWEISHFDRQAIFQLTEQRSVFGAFVALMDYYATCRGMKGWVCKSTHNSPWTNELHEHFPNAKFIYIHRDPRDVSASFLNAAVGSKHSYFIASQWAERQQACLNFQTQVGTSHCHTLAYETLIARPEQTLQRLCRFMAISFSEAMLAPNRSRESHKAAQVGQQWKNLIKPIMANNSGNYRKKLTETDIHIVESCTASIMKILGYGCDMLNIHGLLTFSAEQVHQFAQTAAIRQQEMLNTSSAIEKESRAKMTALKETISQRHIVMA